MRQAETDWDAGQYERFQFETLLAELSSQFINLPVGKVDHEIEAAQRKICECLSLDRSTLWQQPSEQPKALLLTHAHQPPGAPLLPMHTDAARLCPWLLGQVQHGKTMVLSSLGDLPPEAGPDEECLRRHGTKSTIVLPLSTGGAVIGALSFASIRQERDWPESLVQRLQLVADIFASALARKRTDEVLRKSEDRFRSIALNLPGVVYQFYVRDDGQRGMYYLDGRVSDVCGLSAEPLDTFFDRFAACVAAEDREEWLASIQESTRLIRSWDHEVRFIKPTGEEIYLRGFSRPQRLENEVTFNGIIQDVTERMRINAALADSELRYRTLFESAPEGIVLIGTDGCVRAANSAMARLYGYESAQQLLGRHTPLFVAERDRERAVQNLKAQLQGKAISQRHYACVRRDGSEFVGEVTAGLLHGPRQEMQGYLCLTRDVTALVQAEQTLRESEHKFRKLHESMMDAFGCLDMAGRFQESNLALQQMLGYSAEELRALAVSQITPQEWHDFEADVPRKQLLERGYTDVYEKELQKKDGTVFPVEVRAFLIKDESGQPTARWAIVRDITERKRAVETLRHNEERLRLVLEANSEGVWDWNIPSGQAFFSRRYSAMLGYEPDEFPRDYASWKALVHPDDFDRVNEAHYEHIHHYKDFCVELRMRKKSGEWCWILSRGMVVERDAEGHAIRMVGTHLDITERKRIEEALRQRNQYIETVLERAPIGFAVHTIDDGIARFVSARFEEIYGVPRGTITSHHDFFDKVWPYDPVFREQIRSRVVADMTSGVASRMHWQDVPIRLASGETRYISALNIPMFDQNLMISTVQDVTERVRAEAALKQSEVRFRQVAEVTNDFIWEIDTEGLYTYTSPSVEKILGYAPKELVGKLHFYDLFAPDSREHLRRAAFEAFAARRSIRNFPNPNVSKDGKIVHLETTGVPLVDESGKLVGYRGADTDVTERKRAEAELRQTLDELRRLRDKLQEQNVYLEQEVKSLKGQTHLVGDSPALQDVLVQVEQVAPTDATVLLTGETGTGKELIASAIHDLSSRRDHVMVRVNCSAIPSTLIESELFGREKGAYTGALSKQIGRFEVASGSTLFLDEIGELPLDIQVKLLRVLEERRIERLGSSRPIPVNVRIIAATNQDLEKAIREGRFRQDLYYRLNVFPIRVPPLRERREDIPLLVNAFVKEFAEAFGKRIDSVSKASMDALHRYGWPGNVRELKNLVQRGVIVAHGPSLRIETPGTEAAGSAALLTMEEAEREHILRVLEVTGWRIRGQNGAAQILAMKPTTLESRMAKLGIRR